MSGYQGHIRRVASDNLFGVGFEKALRQSGVSMNNLKRWKQRGDELRKSALPSIGGKNRSSSQKPKWR